MRKTSYFITFLAVTLTLVLNILASRRPDWLVVKSNEIYRTRITVEYGLNKLCQLTLTEIPSGSGTITYRDYQCRKFPASETDRCDRGNENFCVAWTSAGYFDQIAIGFAALSLVTILFGVTTHSRRRRIWRAVAGLVLMHSLCQLITFSIITDLYRMSSLPAFDQARPGMAYIINLLSWIAGVLIAVGVVTTGMSADNGHRWAAGNRNYQQIA